MPFHLSQTQYQALLDRNAGHAELSTSVDSLAAPTEASKRVSKEVRLAKARQLAAPFEQIWAALDGPELTTEFQAIPDRKFRFDYCHWDSKTLIELDGGTHSRGPTGHNGMGRLRDNEKANLAQGLGFTVFRLGTGQITQPMVSQIIDHVRGNA